MRRQLAMVAMLGVWMLAGCGGGGGSAPVVKVRGKVTFKGSPVANVNVNFQPVGGRPASGTTDASGTYTLSTFGTDDGAVPGTHKVYLSVSQTTPPPMPGTPEAEAFKPPAPPYPEQYGSADTTPLTVEVAAGKTDYDLDLKE